MYHDKYTDLPMLGLGGGGWRSKPSSPSISH
ncbi:Uncharacterised protein [Mycobacteroides abscessus subsp. abscessus]|nr:Uncharacterised protein [Mycobacteroides abscessus subsp. abscessus]SHP68221.1 Uncharacterised protein [Mycobacteroides abscessus subsp. abscessus]SIA93094.1 Uncharacterised protein [Mycobacteroides abscessus subsp. abscessus]SKI98687.1 Uncharacterised protein [Mycobacteroides abscessus subsp. abscessus]